MADATAPPATTESSAQDRPKEPRDDLGRIVRSDVLRSYPKDVAEWVEQRARTAVRAAQNYERRRDLGEAIGAVLGTIVAAALQAQFTGPRHLLPGGKWGAALLPLVFLLLRLIWEVADEYQEEQRSRLFLSERFKELSASPDVGTLQWLKQWMKASADLEKDERNRPVIRRGLWVIVLKVAVTLVGLGLVVLLLWSAGWLPVFATLAAAILCAVIGELNGRLWGRPTLRLDPRDALIGIFVKVTAHALPQSFDEQWSRLTIDWRTNSSSRAWFAQALERAGRDARRLVPQMAPWSGGLRRLMRARAERIASGFHALALAVTLGGRDRDERTVESLVAGLVAACTDDWEALTQADPRPLRREAMRTWILRGTVASAFVGVSLVLLAFTEESTTRQQIVFTLWGAALAALASPQGALGRVADRVEALGKGQGG